jgi:hypothetical protein
MDPAPGDGWDGHSWGRTGPSPDPWDTAAWARAAVLGSRALRGLPLVAETSGPRVWQPMGPGTGFRVFGI